MLLVFSGCSTTAEDELFSDGEINGKCRTGDSPCDTDLACISNYCVPDSCVDANCAEWETCSRGICKVNEGSCNNNGDCNGSETCNTTSHLCAEAVCDPACDSWETCNAGLCKTNPGRCDSVSQCDSGQTCDTNTHTCISTGDPCSGVTCGGTDKGECIATQSGAFCDCKPGYAHFDNAGNKILDCVNPCEGITCSGKGECQVISAQPICTCDGLGTATPYTYPKDGLGNSIKTECVLKSVNDSLVLHMPLDDSAENIANDENNGVTFSTSEPFVCSEGRFQCNGTTSQECVDNTWTDVENCETKEGDDPFFCSALDGKCSGTADCSGSETSCLGNTLRTCNGSGYWQSTDCMATGKTCGDGLDAKACVAECTGTNSICYGTKVLTCSEGTYIETLDCNDSSQICQLGMDEATCVDAKAPSTTPVEGKLTYVDGLFGKAANFDGIDDFIKAKTDGTNSMTLSVWVKPESVEDMMTLLSGDGQYDLKFINQENDYVYIDTSLTGTTISSSPATKKLQHYVVPNEWHLVTMVYSIANNWEIYLDNNSLFSYNGPIFSELQGDKDLFIAADTNYKNLFKGLMDDLRVYNKELTSSEINSLSERGAYRVCEQTDCGGHGTCKVKNYKAECSCDDGYYKESLNCKAIPVSDGLILLSPMQRHGDIVSNGSAGITNDLEKMIYYQGVSGMAMNLDSINDTVTIETSEPFTTGNQLTIAGWIKPNHLLNGVVFKNSELRMAVVFENGQLLYVRDDEKNGTVASTLITDNAWHHIAITADTAGSLTIYIDGKSEKFAYSIGGEDQSYELSLGEINGLLDEVMFFDRILTDAEITSLFTAGGSNETLCKDVTCSDKGTCSIVQNKAVCDCETGYVPNEMLECVKEQESDIHDGLLAHYSFESSASKTAGSLTGIDGVPVSVGYPAGKVGSGASFNGDSSIITIPHNDGFNFKGDFSISLFVKLPIDQSNTDDITNTILTKWQVNYGEGMPPIMKPEAYPFAIRVTNGKANTHYQNKIQVSQGSDNSSQRPVSHSVITINDDQFHHLVMMKKGERIYTYIDQKLEAVFEVTATDFINTAPITIGKRGDNALPFSGMIDELKFYNRALTLDEITQLGNAN